MSLHICPGDILFWIAIWPIFGERNCPFGFLLKVFFYCGAVALSNPSFPSGSSFPFRVVPLLPIGVFDGRC